MPSTLLLLCYPVLVKAHNFRDFVLCRACSQMLKVPTMLLVGDSDKYFWPEMWQHLDRHVQNCWLPQAWHMLQNCSHWCPQDW